MVPFLLLVPAYSAAADPWSVRDSQGQMIDLEPAAATCGIFPVRPSDGLRAQVVLAAARRHLAAREATVLVVQDNVSLLGPAQAWVRANATGMNVVFDPVSAISRRCSALPVMAFK